MRFLRAGRSARLIEVAGLNEMLALYSALQSAALPGVLEVVPSARTVLVKYDRAVTSAGELEQRIPELPLTTARHTDTPVLIVPTRYDGVDLDVVCRSLAMTEPEFVDWHTTQQWWVGFAGFAPGFGYLVSEDHAIAVPRLQTPRTSVPAGSVAMAGEFTGIYPRSSPGGWQIIGHTDRVLFDLEASPPSELTPGRRVRFVAVGSQEAST